MRSISVVRRGRWLIAVLWVMTGISGCESIALFGCDHSQKLAAFSPDGVLVARTIEVGCGATTADATWVTLSRSGAAPDTDRDLVASFEGRLDALHWNGHALVVTYHDAKPVFLVSLFYGTQVRYVDRARE